MIVALSTNPVCSSQYGETSVPPPAKPKRNGARETRILVKLDFYEAPVIQSAALLSAHAETNRRSTILPSKTQLSREKYVSPLATVQNLMHYSVLSAS